MLPCFHGIILLLYRKGNLALSTNIFKNKTEYTHIKKAVALKYDSDKNSAPKIIAKGFGIVGEKIVEKAKESKVPIYPDSNLAQILIAMNLGDEIPPELYEVVAEVLVFIGYMDKKYGEMNE